MDRDVMLDRMEKARSKRLPDRSMPKPEPEKKRFTADEIEQFLHEIAADPSSGADRFRAIKMLRGQGEAEGDALLADEDVQNFLTIEMKALGSVRVQAAYKKAFPSQKAPEFSEPRIDESMLSKEAMERVRRCLNLRLLYKIYPQTKRSGFPPGYPVGRGVEVIKEWAQRMAMKIEVDREMAVIGPRKVNGNPGLEIQPDAPR